MSGVKIKYKLSQDQFTAVEYFCRSIKVPVDTFCKQAVFYSINHATSLAKEVAKDLKGTTDGPYDASRGDTEGNTEEVRIESSDNSNALSNTENTDSPKEG